MKKSCSSFRSLSSHTRKDLEKKLKKPLIKYKIKHPQTCKSKNKPIISHHFFSKISKTASPSPKSQSPLRSKTLIKSLSEKAKRSSRSSKENLKKLKPKPKKINEHTFKSYLTQQTSSVFEVPETLSSPKEISRFHEKIHQAHLNLTFSSLKLMKNISKPLLHEIEKKLIDLPKNPKYKKIVVFDLDETLIHCVDPNKGQESLLITFPSGESVKVTYNQIGLNIRPHVKECLSEVSKFFEVIVFTASHKRYADTILDFLDPDQSLIKHRLYRENCVIVNGVHIKDLRIFKNRELENIVIVDNSVQSFAFHLDNGIPIITWHNNKYDTELHKLIDYLKLLAVEDICSINRKTFKLSSMCENFY